MFNFEQSIKHKYFIEMGNTKEKTNITDKAKQLTELHSKTWLANELGITRATLYTRLEHENWKKSEIQTILLHVK